MTGGRVVILGPTGKNFAAGMSGGVAYVLDENSDLYLKLNKDLVSSQPVTDKYDVLELKKIIEEHVEAYRSDGRKRIKLRAGTDRSILCTQKSGINYRKYCLYARLTYSRAVR